MSGPVTLTAAEVQLFSPGISDELAEQMITDAIAMAAITAPCIEANDFPYTGAAKAIIRGAILRWHESGSGAAVSESVGAGPYSKSVTYDTRQTRKSMFWPSELTELRKLCGKTTRSAYSIDLAAALAVAPPPIVDEADW